MASELLSIIFCSYWKKLNKFPSLKFNLCFIRILNFLAESTAFKTNPNKANNVMVIGNIEVYTLTVNLVFQHEFKLFLDTKTQ